MAEGSGEEAVVRELERVVGQLPGGEVRTGQVEMARQITQRSRSGKHLIVRAGTGTGKTLGYLVPAILSGKRVVVATATKALQDQLATKDLPFLEEHLKLKFSWAVLKGRSNYVCQQRLTEVRDQRRASGQMELDGLASRANRDQLSQIIAWAATTTTGDRAELPEEPTDATWMAVSTTSRDCPGVHRCPAGQACFAQQARELAASSDVIVVNLHLYGLHLASGGTLLPDHDLVIIDEAHVLDEVITATSGREVGPGRFTNLGRMARGVLSDDEGSSGPDLDSTAEALASILRAHRGQRLRMPLPDQITTGLATSRQQVSTLDAALGRVPDTAPETTQARTTRARLAATALVDDLDALMQPSETDVIWVEGTEESPALRLAPLEIAPLLRSSLWEQRPAVLTSATIAAGLGRQLGLPTDAEVPLDVGSPFNYQANALIYCAEKLPRPSDPAWRDAAIDELATLIKAAGGRTLALFTSYKAMASAAEALRERLSFRILLQGELPKAKLVQEFTAHPETCLFATMSFWQGIDVPGPSLSLVTIDRLPFPRPDEPLLEARRERMGNQAFLAIDVPRAATLLAQGVGRLIRTSSDRGAVAVLDSRLATARYGPKIVAALPKMRRTRDRNEILKFLKELQ